MTVATKVDGEPSAAELRRLLDVQRQSFLADGPPSLAVRRDRIDRLVSLVTDNADAIVEALDADFGSRPRTPSMVNDVIGYLPDLVLTRRRLKAWMKPRRVLPGTAAIGFPIKVESVPLGVVGVIGPWNFPVGLTIEPAAAAFAGGNRVMLKFSEVTWRTAALMAELVPRYFDATELVVVNGGAETAAAFSALPFDHLFFTGSPGVGSLVAQAAAKNLTPVTLELGGKNPAVVVHGADIEEAAARIASARIANGGQVCLCPDEVYVPRANLDAFVAAVTAASRAVFPSVLGSDTFISIVDDRNYDRIVGLIDDAVAKGATKVDAAPEGEVLPDRATRRIAPTFLLGVTAEMEIDREEVFGPVLSIHPYDRVEDVVERLAERPLPLAAYWFGPTRRDFDYFRTRVRCGGITVQDFAAHCGVMVAPFGGVGRSGSGAYHGRTGFDTFTHQRTMVVNRTPVALAKLATPPYSPRFERGLERVVRSIAKKAAARRRRTSPARFRPQD
ncbi:aldehyde dehydrogenase family protein [Nocardioides marmoriginsengisoli]|uniref:Aldehyde dehydrogenase n=1 Tax=Nocardioides marmoriginsengisoli TaxID=661483 RepID=A0A3N0CD49_9ACTN|nr:aldehyde dehydrogenase family protein [Nocardioides marmoriginsengisoli]RNL61380.1 aldehyde dehydrogenase family protein [Nocardioides marmoriginsengisoli]